MNSLEKDQWDNPKFRENMRINLIGKIMASASRNEI